VREDCFYFGGKKNRGENRGKRIPEKFVMSASASTKSCVRVCGDRGVCMIAAIDVDWRIRMCVCVREAQ